MHFYVIFSFLAALLKISSCIKQKVFNNKFVLFFNNNLKVKKIIFFKCSFKKINLVTLFKKFFFFEELQKIFKTLYAYLKKRFLRKMPFKNYFFEKFLD